LALNSKLYSTENDAASVIIDGIHIKYFGQPSIIVITSYIQLLAEKEKCFLVSFFTIFKTLDFARLLGIFSTYCLKEESVGATESSFNSTITMEIIKSVSEKLKNEIEAILKKEFKN